MFYLSIQTGTITPVCAGEQMLGIYFGNLRSWEAADCEDMEYLQLKTQS